MNIITELQSKGFLKIKNADELSSIATILKENGYSLVGTDLLAFNPFTSGRKKCIYLMLGWNEELRIKYRKWVWWADVLDKKNVSELFPFGKPYSL